MKIIRSGVAIMVFYAGMGNPMGMGGSGSFGGMGGNPTAFANPGMNPTYLAMLQQMQGAGGNAGMGGMNPPPTFPPGGGVPGGLGATAANQLGSLLPRVGQPGAMPGAAGAVPPGAGATPGAGGISPQMLAYLQAMGLLPGGQGGPGAGSPGLLTQLGLGGGAGGGAPNQGLLGGFFNRA